jgi:hypothetical protein
VQHLGICGPHYPERATALISERLSRPDSPNFSGWGILRSRYQTNCISICDTSLERLDSLLDGCIPDHKIRSDQQRYRITAGAAEVPVVGVEDENLDGLTDAVEVQEAPGAPTKP